MEHQKMCRVCLMINVKMYSIDLPSLFTAYSQFTGYKIMGLYRYVCFECAALLRKCYAFKLKCQQAQEVLGNDAVPLAENILNRFRVLLHSPLKITSKVIADIEPVETIEVKPVLTETIKEEVNEHKLEGAFDDNGSMDQFTVEVPIPYNDSSDENESVTKKKRKRKATTVKKKPKTESKDVDDLPLAKIIKNKKSKANVTKSKPKPAKKPASKKETTNKVLKFDLSLIEEFTTVVVLTHEDAKKELELRKESSNYRECSFKCSLCYRGFESQKSFDNHMKKHSLENGNIECEICHMRVKNKRVLNKHNTSCHKNKYSCKICPYICFSTSQVKSHINLHKGIKYTCEHCGEKFSMANSLCMHKRIKHATECVCALCGSSFATKRGLQGHTALIHRHEVNEELGPKCEDCNVKFSSETAWKRHLVLSSKHKTSNGCEFCGEMFPDAESLKKHMRTHSRKKRSDIKLPAPCPLCEDWLTDRGMYKEHMTSSHPDSNEARRIQANENGPVVCEVCGKRFTMPCFLRYHQRKHTGERPYGCGVCGKTFVFLRTLATHRVEHDANNAKHKCTLCAKRFVFRSVLMKHVRTTHLNVRPHKCEVCGKCFATRCEVKYHAQYVHDKVPWPKRDRSKPRATDEQKKWLQANISNM